MRVLTVRQPWAWAIIHGGKDVENRSRNIAGSYRGPVAIHAGLSFADLTEDQNKQISHEVGRLARGKLPGAGLVPSRFGDPNDSAHWVAQRYGHRGAIIGVVDLIDAHVSDTHAERWNVELERNEQCSAWALPNHHHLVLDSARAIEPIPAKGKLGLWKPDAELLAQIEATP